MQASRLEYPTNAVSLQGHPISGIAPTNGQMLQFLGGIWTPVTLPIGDPLIVTDVNALTIPLAAVPRTVRLLGRLSGGGQTWSGEVLLYVTAVAVAVSVYTIESTGGFLFGTPEVSVEGGGYEVTLPLSAMMSGVFEQSVR